MKSFSISGSKGANFAVILPLMDESQRIIFSQYYMIFHKITARFTR